MAKAVFTHKAGSIYDDLPEQRYHFPRTYLRQVEAAVGDWIVYYEPRRPDSRANSTGGRQVYFAVARVQGLRPDPALNDHFYADVTDYLEFDHPVPFRHGTRFYEAALDKGGGETSKGAFGRAVRAIPNKEYHDIVQAGFATLLCAAEPDRTAQTTGVAEEPTPYEVDRPIIERLITRPFRDAAFSEAVRRAYANTCAITGLKIINGGGRPEVQAAHIRPVADRGPDSVRNGLALSGTIHWMFDRGLLSVDDDYSVLLAKDRVPAALSSMLRPDHRLILPSRPDLRPHPEFLRYHRSTVFKG